MSQLANGYCRVPEAARYLSLGTRTIWEMIRIGKIPTYRLGRKVVLLKYQDLDEWMNEKKVVAENG